MRKLAQLKLHDRNGIALANQSGIQVAWFDQAQPKDFTSVAYKNGAETTDEDGNLVVDIDGSTSLNESDLGFLLAYQPNLSDHRDSLVFAGKLNVSLGILNGADLFLPGDLGFWHWPQDLSSMFQDSTGTIAAVLGQPIGKVLDKTSIGYNATQATTSLKPILKRMPTSGVRNLLVDSDDIYASGEWTTSRNWSPAEVIRYNTQSIGKSWRLTGDNVAFAYFRKSLSGDGVSKACAVVVEKTPGDTAITTDIGLYDSTAVVFASRNRFTWATEAVSLLNGAGGAIKLASVGPNGGAVFKLWCSGAVTAGNAEQCLFYPIGTSASINTVIVHDMQIEIGTGISAHQITVGGYDVYEEGFEQVYWLDYDQVDDKLVASNTDLGTNATRIRLNVTGVTIEEGLTLGANLELYTDNLGLIVINRALSAAEKSAITAYLNKFVGL